MIGFSWENARQLSSSFSKILVTSATLEGNRVICKVSKTQHQNPEFCHTQGEILKKTCKKSTFAFAKGCNSENHRFWWQTKFHPVFPFS
jgi:hypothetical protein